MIQKPNQRLDSLSNAHVGREFEVAVQEHFAQLGLNLKRGHKVQIGLQTKKTHAFDLGSDEERVLVECTAYRWTVTGKNPSAKLTTLNQEMLYFLVAPTTYRKILCIEKSLHTRKGSLGRYYVRQYAHLIPEGVEFWERDPVLKQAEQIYPVVNEIH